MLKKISWKILIVAISSFLFVSIIITWFFAEREMKASRSKLNGLLTVQATEMVNNVNYALTQAYSLQALVLGNDGAKININEMGKLLINKEYAGYVRNILVAPKGIVSQVYPLKGNENVIGLNLYSRNNASASDAIHAQQSGEITVTGPYQLVQGGQAISGRIAVRLPREDGKYEDWGLVSVTLAFPEAMQSTGVGMLANEGYAYRVSRKDKKSGKYIEILNYSFKEQEDYEALNFSFKKMEFKIEAYPIGGWVAKNNIVSVFFISFLGLLFLGFGIGSLWINQDVLREKATKDAMTGLLNRVSGKSLIKSILRNKEFKQGVFILIDLDHFKEVNDTLMHKTGDTVLIETAEQLKNLFRSNDIVYRLGGDEFVVFMNCPNGYEFLKEKIHNINKIMRRKIEADNKAVQISCSIGIALAPEHGGNVGELYAKADQALYYSKENGRDCATIYPDELV